MVALAAAGQRVRDQKELIKNRNAEDQMNIMQLRLSHYKTVNIQTLIL